MAAVTELNNPDNLQNILDVKQTLFNDISKSFDVDIHEIGSEDFKFNKLDIKEVHSMLNHPVHVIQKSGKLSPSALVPFCKFGNWMGVKIEHFDVPVCDLFKATILNDRLCYETGRGCMYVEPTVNMCGLAQKIIF